MALDSKSPSVLLPTLTSIMWDQSLQFDQGKALVIKLIFVNLQRALLHQSFLSAELVSPAPLAVDVGHAIHQWHILFEGLIDADRRVPAKSSRMTRQMYDIFLVSQIVQLLYKESMLLRHNVFEPVLSCCGC
jgi:hypothetical protein